MGRASLGKSVAFSVAIAVAVTLAIPRDVRAVDSTARPDAGPCPVGMVLVAGGTTALGANDPDALAPGPRTIQSLCVDRTEVTVSQYLACVRKGACAAAESTIFFPGYGPPEPMRGQLSAHCNAPRSDRRDHPMNCIDQDTASRYCASEGGRLPSEEEWEHVARGPSANRYPWGAEAPRGALGPLCWDRRDAGLGTCTVGQFPRGATKDGVLDMAGNVWEWTTSAPSGRSGPFVVRGGGWTNFLPRFVSATYSWPLAPKTRLNCLGFRCVRPASTSSEQ